MDEIEDIDLQRMEIERLKAHIRMIASMCGNPDAKLACRLVLEEVKEALGG